MNLDHSPRRRRRRSSPPSVSPNSSRAPTLDAEHLLAALLEPDDGVPAETLRRLGVDLPALRDELAGLLAVGPESRAARCPSDPRARQVLDRAGTEAKRLNDDYVSTEHLLLGIAEAGGEGAQLLPRAGAGREAILQALQSVRGGQRVTSRRTRRPPTRRSRSTAAT